MIEGESPVKSTEQVPQMQTQEQEQQEDRRETEAERKQRLIPTVRSVISTGNEFIRAKGLQASGGYYSVELNMSNFGSSEETFGQNCGLLSNEGVEGVQFSDHQDSSDADMELTEENIMAIFNATKYRTVMWNPKKLEAYLKK